MTAGALCCLPAAIIGYQINSSGRNFSIPAVRHSKNPGSGRSKQHRTKQGRSGRHKARPDIGETARDLCLTRFFISLQLSTATPLSLLPSTDCHRPPPTARCNLAVPHHDIPAAPLTDPVPGLAEIRRSTRAHGSLFWELGEIRALWDALGDLEIWPERWILDDDGDSRLRRSLSRPLSSKRQTSTWTPSIGR